LCQKVTDNNIKIWNFDWVTHNSLKKIIENNPIIDEQEIEEIERIIEPNEVKIFGY